MHASRTHRYDSCDQLGSCIPFSLADRKLCPDCRRAPEEMQSLDGRSVQEYSSAFCIQTRNQLKPLLQRFEWASGSSMQFSKISLSRS